MDWMRKYRGKAKLVLKPKTTEEVSKILKYCNEQKLAVVPQGGNSGLVGGSVPVFDEIVISTASMNKIRSFDAVSGILVADAGVILENADQFLAEQGHLFPLDLGAKGSCHIGGNVATNAGGLRLLRYGSLHGTVLGLEVVLPDGTIFEELSQLRKNNTGFDLKQLFIGSEGTIGIITAVSILCPRRPTSTKVAYMGLSSYEAVQQAFVKAKEQLGEILSAFEMMDGRTQSMIKETTGKKPPLDDEYPFYVLIETSGSREEHDEEKLNGLLESLLEEEIVLDGTVAENQSQIVDLWSWREGIPEATRHWGGVYRYDVSIPLPQLYDLVGDARSQLKKAGVLTGGPDSPVVDAVGFGHMGDGNLHLNVATRGYSKEIENALEPFVYEWIKGVKGSISAEHGLGFAKRKFIGYSRDETSVRLMRDIKKLYDPNGIMNP